VIGTGPYRFVRHLGYVAALLFLFFGMAFALGSFWAPEADPACKAKTACAAN
jgi:protein-S-isoprenylcysteine O-methyltransferase Ste14